MIKDKLMPIVDGCRALAYSKRGVREIRIDNNAAQLMPYDILRIDGYEKPDLNDRLMVWFYKGNKIKV